MAGIFVLSIIYLFFLWFISILIYLPSSKFTTLDIVGLGDADGLVHTRVTFNTFFLFSWVYLWPVSLIKQLHNFQSIPDIRPALLIFVVTLLRNENDKCFHWRLLKGRLLMLNMDMRLYGRIHYLEGKHNYSLGM